MRGWRAWWIGAACGKGTAAPGGGVCGCTPNGAPCPKGAAKLGAEGLVSNGLNVAGKRFHAGAAKGRLAAPKPSVMARAIVMSRRLRISRLRSIDRRITVMCLNATEARTFPAGRGEHDTVRRTASHVCAMEPYAGGAGLL